MHVHSACICILSCACKMHWHMSNEYAYTGGNTHVQKYAHAHLQMPIPATPPHILCWLSCPGLSQSHENITVSCCTECNVMHEFEICPSVTLFSIFSQDCDNKCEYAFTGSRRHSSHVMMLLGIVNRLSIPHAGEFRQCFPQKGLSWDQIVPPGLLWDREPPQALLWGCQPSLPAWASSKLTAAAGGRFWIKVESHDYLLRIK